MTSKAGNSHTSAPDLRAEAGLEGLIREADLAPADEDSGVELIQALHAAFSPLEPRREFADALRSELLGAPQGKLARWRGMPARVHLAAALALMAGFALLIMRRLFGSEPPQEMGEEAVAAPL